jgi:propanediol dehydratase large subunit
MIADHSIDTSIAEKAMAIDSTQFARMLVDINVPRGNCAPSRTDAGQNIDVFKKMNVVELMMAMQRCGPAARFPIRPTTN